MSDGVDQVTCDEAARELIRKKLIRHMKKVRIGVPTLAKQIMAQNPGNEIKSAMLHRVLNGRTRTQDRFVALFHSFAESLPGGIRN